MQPGTHRKLAHRVRSRTPGIRPRYSDPGKLRKPELRAIARALDIDLLELREDLDEPTLYNRHLRWKIAVEIGETDEETPALAFDERFSKRHKRALATALEEVSD